MYIYECRIYLLYTSQYVLTIQFYIKEFYLRLLFVCFFSFYSIEFLIVCNYKYIYTYICQTYSSLFLLFFYFDNYTTSIVAEYRITCDDDDDDEEIKIFSFTFFIVPRNRSRLFETIEPTFSYLSLSLVVFASSILLFFFIYSLSFFKVSCWFFL